MRTGTEDALGTVRLPTGFCQPAPQTNSKVISALLCRAARSLCLHFLVMSREVHAVREQHLGSSLSIRTAGLKWFYLSTDEVKKLSVALNQKQIVFLWG